MSWDHGGYMQVKDACTNEEVPSIDNFDGGMPTISLERKMHTIKILLDKMNDKVMS